MPPRLTGGTSATADPEHVEQLLAGVDHWNSWRRGQEAGGSFNVLTADLSGANLSGASLAGADLASANLSQANLSGASLFSANLSRANLSGADLKEANLERASLVEACLSGADLSAARLVLAVQYKAELIQTRLTGAALYGATMIKADLSAADLAEADLTSANLIEANLTGASLRGANLEQSSLVRANLTGADLTGCRVYGSAAWGVTLDEAIQKDLIITHEGEPEITLDNLDLAQFLYLLLENEKIREILDTTTSKVVLILGSFAAEPKAILDAIRDELRDHHNYVPIMFDFTNTASRNYNETITTLARMARFVIADLTDAKELRSELISIVSQLPSVAVQPILKRGAKLYATFEADIRRNRKSVLKVYRYADRDSLLANLRERIIEPAEAKTKRLRRG